MSPCPLENIPSLTPPVLLFPRQPIKIRRFLKKRAGSLEHGKLHFPLHSSMNELVDGMQARYKGEYDDQN
jgi:hypothetical protein